jgi:hypothetical protein
MCTYSLHSVCFDILLLDYGRSLCYPITCFVLTGSTLLVIDILLCFGYDLSVCHAVLCALECTAVFSRKFLSLPALSGGWHPIYDRPISLYLPRVSHQLQAPRVMSRAHYKRHPLCFLAGKFWFSMIDIPCPVSFTA